MVDEGVERALTAALEAHEGQTRRGSAEPYVAHPLHVALLLARQGAGPLVLQAGLLHDVVEDCAGWTLERVEGEFGLRVASIVAELTEDKTRTWRERKEQQVEIVPSLSEEAVLIKACDKLHNLSTLGASLERAHDPAEVWALFHGGREATIDTSGRLVEALVRRLGEESDLSGALRAAMETVACA
ncbi:MAG TPA: bifunctional (p)ppGpp synthetase/guanosine-3',5'-bis(diphosphate) 3'-pyrophosphohydrolase [Planctomycetes bacterium]|nr:bifunctional (p)ppGpp synthetase/guanosine-3',5'-bis(diphosphate) 3'-pyrophosphohydrolase [Planctomycetota bacterium]